MKTIEVKITEMFQTPDYDRNYDNAMNHDAEETCICCGRKLNPKTMKWAFALEPGDFTDYEDTEFPQIYSEENRQVSMGCYPVGPKCYAEIRRRLRVSNETRTIITEL